MTLDNPKGVNVTDRLFSPNLVEVLPIVLGHEAERAEEGVEEVVVAGVAVVGVVREAPEAVGALGAGAGAGGVAADDGRAGVGVDDPVGPVIHPVGPSLVVARAPGVVVVPGPGHVELWVCPRLINT